jgi:hypothetical protein
MEKPINAFVYRFLGSATLYLDKKLDAPEISKRRELFGSRQLKGFTTNQTQLLLNRKLKHELSSYGVTINV